MRRFELLMKPDAETQAVTMEFCNTMDRFTDLNKPVAIATYVNNFEKAAQLDPVNAILIAADDIAKAQGKNGAQFVKAAIDSVVKLFEEALRENISFALMFINIIDPDSKSETGTPELYSELQITLDRLIPFTPDGGEMNETINAHRPGISCKKWVDFYQGHFRLL